jgi:aminocarboxymuconate-semialdehyde decarboxylase
MSTPLDIVDVHTHLWPPAYGPGGARQKSGFAFSADIYRKLTTPAELVSEFENAGISLAVVTTTIESLFDPEGAVDAAIIAETNDWLATLVADHPGRLAAFATIDAFSGEAGAREAERAILTHGLSGLVIDSARNGLFLADNSVRPTLEVAATHKVPIFVHPVARPNSDVLIAGAGKNGNSLGRGLMNGVAFLSLLEAGILDDFPDLDFIFATLGIGAIVQAARGGKFGRDVRNASHRPNVYFDTMGDDPRIVRALVDFFGAERVLAGTDWPILAALTRDGLASSLTEAGISDAEQRLIAGGNARRLLAVPASREQAAE